MGTQRIQRRVDQLVEQALSGRVNLGAIAADPDVDETDRVMIYVDRQIGHPPGLRNPSETTSKVIQAMVLQELQRRDILAGRDPGKRITDDHHRWLGGFLAQVAAGRQQDKERGGPSDL